MNNSSHNGENHHRQPSAPPGHPSLPPQFQHHLQQHRPQQQQDPQLAFLLANAAAARGQSPAGGVAGHLGAGNSNNGGGFGNPGPFGNGSERHGASSGMSHSAAAQLFEEQILQRASALRAEALMQQQQQQQQQQSYGQQHSQQQQLQIQAALQAFQQQQQQLSSLNGPAPPSDKVSPRMKAIDPHQQLLQQQQEAALLARAAALRDLGLAGSAGGPPPASALLGAAGGTTGLDRVREQLVNNELMRRQQQQQQQQQQQSQQRVPFGLEQELERVRQAQRLAAMGSPKSSAPSGPPMVADGASALFSKMSTNAASETHSGVEAIVAAQKAMQSSSDGSERVVPSAVTSTPKGPKKSEAAQNENEVSKASKQSSLPSPGTSAALAKAGRTTPPLKPNARSILIPEKAKGDKKNAGAGAAAAAAAVRCKTKEELRKNPGTVIVPCRARGMPMDHNFISAYFVISEDAKHGENLVCSYYACRNGGIKFRYCAYCMAPVAKRNFSRRHDHGMSKKKGASGSREEVEEEDDDDSLGESENTASDKGSMSSAAIPTQPSVKRPKELPSSEIQSKRPKLEADTITVEEKVSDVGEEITSKRRSMWNDLLNKRPRAKDPKGLSSWLNEVIAVSDLEFPLENVGTDINRPFGKVLLNELPKLTKPAVTPSEDEAVDSNGAIDTMDTNSNSSPETMDSSTKDVTNSNSDSMGISNNATNTSAADTVVGNEKETKTTTETVKNKTSESQDPVTEETAVSKTNPQTPVTTNKVTDSVGSSTSSSKGVKLLGKTAKPSPKKSIVEETQKRKKKEDEGFAGSFADWRDRKKGKLLKKGSSSLRK